MTHVIKARIEVWPPQEESRTLAVHHDPSTNVARVFLDGEPVGPMRLLLEAIILPKAVPPPKHDWVTPFRRALYFTFRLLSFQSLALAQDKALEEQEE